MSRVLATPRGADEHGLLMDLAHRRGFVVRALGDGTYQVEKGGERRFKGSAAQVNRWLRDNPA
jgi:hypothetical protein